MGRNWEVLKASKCWPYNEADCGCCSGKQPVLANPDMSARADDVRPKGIC